MSDKKSCPSCGAALASDATRGVCPACLLEAGFATGGAPAAGDRVPTIEELAPKFPGLAIEALVGRGGMGVVFRARHKALDREVALKVLSAAVAAEPAFADRFQREARALAKLQHPNIVAVHDFGVTDGLYWLVMEYVDGVNVREAMRAGSIGPQQALAIVPQICDALQYAHEHGVVHRDIKPENILLDKTGRVKVADFGLAKLTNRAVADATLTGAGQVMGTLHYMAPEQWEHPKDVDHRADIYSLGVVFYEMLTGELPVGRFAAPSTKSSVDARIDEIVLRTLEREREARYQQVSQVKTAVGIVTSSVAPVAAAADVHVTRTVQTGFGHGPRAELVYGAVLAAVGAVWWTVKDCEIAWLVLPLAGLALMMIAVVHQLRSPAPARPSAPNWEFAVGMLLVAAGTMARLTPRGDDRDALAWVVIAVGWLLAAFGGPSLLVATKFAPSTRKLIAWFFAATGAFAGICAAVALVLLSLFPAHAPAPILARAHPSADTTGNASQTHFVAETAAGSPVDITADERRRIVELWDRVRRLSAAPTLAEAADLYSEFDGDALKAMSAASLAQEARAGRLGLPLLPRDVLSCPDLDQCRLTRVRFDVTTPAEVIDTRIVPTPSDLRGHGPRNAIATATDGRRVIRFTLSRRRVGGAADDPQALWYFAPGKVTFE